MQTVFDDFDFFHDFDGATVMTSATSASRVGCNMLQPTREADVAEVITVAPSKSCELD